jgi:hypothetical protein
LNSKALPLSERLSSNLNCLSGSLFILQKHLTEYYLINFGFHYFDNTNLNLHRFVESRRNSGSPFQNSWNTWDNTYCIEEEYCFQVEGTSDFDNMDFDIKLFIIWFWASAFFIFSHEQMCSLFPACINLNKLIFLIPLAKNLQ